MFRPGQHGWTFLVLVVALAGCGGSQTTEAPAPVSVVEVPELAVAGLRGTTTALDADLAAKEAVDPAAFSAALADAGFLGATDRTLTGGAGTFSRVVIRAWTFGSPTGARAFGAWVVRHADQLIGAARPIRGDDVDVLRHDPSGCCHEEVPVYLAVWQEDTVVWTVRTSGRRIHTAPAMALIDRIRKET